VQRLAEALAQKKEYSIQVLTSQHQKELKQQDVLENVSITRVPYLFKMSKGFFMPQYFLKVWKEVKKSDVVVVNLPQFEACIVAVLARLLGKRLYCIYHCEVELPLGIFSSVIQFLLQLSHTITLLCSEKIITYTDDYAKHSKLLPRFMQKVTYIYPPIPIPQASSAWQKKLKSLIPKNTFVIGIAARIAAEKGFEYIFEALPLIQKQVNKEVVILIAGPKNPVGEEAYWKKIQVLLYSHTKQIIFLGTMPSAEMGSFYQALDVLVLPSVNSTEAFGMVQVEAMVCGTPVVASNLPGVRVPIQVTGMGEIAQVKNIRDIADKVAKVVQYKNKYVRKAHEISAIFSFSNTIAAYEKVFTRVP